ncbi:MAG: aromatic acid exporter family protein [bacterium]|nr:aromatic acid exporter family protein [bacterium]
MNFKIKIRDLDLIRPFASRSHRTPREITEWLFKLVVTVMLSLFMGRLFRISDMLTLVFVTLLCLQPTTLGGLRIGIQQLLVAGFSSLFTLALIQIVNNYYFTVSVSIAAVSFYLVATNKENLLAVAFFSVLYIGVLGRDKPISFFFDRVEHLIIGIPVATFSNYAFGVFQYRKKLMTGIIKIRMSIFHKSGRMLDALRSGGNLSVEDELNGLANYYQQMDQILTTLEDFEKEYKSFFSFLFMKIRNIGRYKQYIWNLHDLLQSIHTTATLSFKIPLSPEVREHIRSFSDIIKKYRARSLDTDLDGLLDKYQEVCRQSSDSIIMGNLFSLIFHLRAVQEFEESLEELKTAFSHVKIK